MDKLYKEDRILSVKYSGIILANLSIIAHIWEMD